MMKRKRPFALAVCLLFTLAACTASSPQASNSPKTGDGPTGASNSPGSGEDPTSAYAQDFAQAVAALDADKVMFTVNGEAITAEYFLYWLAYDCYDWSSYTGGQLDFDSQVSEDMTVAEFIKEDAQRMAAFYVTLEQKAAELGCGLTQEQWAQWEEIKAGYRAEMGEERFALSLRQMGLTEAGFDRIGQVREMSGLYDNLTAALTTAPTKADMDEYTAENDTYRAKHILILTAVEGEDGEVALSTGGAPVNEDGTPFTGTAEEYNLNAMDRALRILAEINAASDPIAKFDELMLQYSQDTGLAANPDGYLFSSGQMVEPFENATKALEYGAYTAQPVESRFGYHIILRLGLEEECRNAQMGDIITGWIDEMAILNVAPEYEALNVADFYEKYTAYAEKLYNEWQEMQAADASPAPEG